MQPFELTNEQKEQYWEEGYTVVRGFMSEAELAPLRQHARNFLEGDHDWPDTHFQILNPEEYQNPRGGFLPTGVQGPAQREEDFRRIAEHPRLQATMSQLLGGEVEKYTDQFLIRHGLLKEGQGGRSFYHQDSYYWHLEPQRGCNAWITLNEVGAEAGALGIMPGTQKDWTLAEHETYYDEPSYHVAANGRAFQRHRIPHEKIDQSRDLILPMQAGDAAFFTNFTWHRAEPNFTGQDQCAYAIAYQLRQDEKE